MTYTSINQSRIYEECCRINDTFKKVNCCNNKICLDCTINLFKKSVFGDGEYADYYFYTSIVAFVFILILLMRR
jgi:hypothetical protein